MEDTRINYVFDATQHELDAGFEPLPADIYVASISDTKMEAIKATEGEDKGSQLYVEFTVTEGAFKGRKLVRRYGILNKNSAQAVEIAHKQLTALCYCVGQFKLEPRAMREYGAELRGKNLRVRVINDGKYNEIKEVFDINGNKPSKSGSGMSMPQTAPVATATPSAWGNAPVAPVTPSAPVFPPEGWTAHPSAPGYFYKDQEVLTEAQLRERQAPATVPTLPATPPAAPAANPWGQQPAVAANATPPWGQK